MSRRPVQRIKKLLLGFILLTSFLPRNTPMAAPTSVGDLNFLACLANGVSGCTDPGGTALASPTALTLSPDGRTVYVASQPTAAGDIAWLDRDSVSGNLTYQGCIGQGVSRCANISSASPLYGPISLVSLSDSLYVVSSSSSLAHFQRSRLDGSLTFANCFAYSASGCATLSGTNVLSGVHAVAVSADGNSLYLASATGYGAIATFQRDATNGDLSYIGCVGQSVAGCSSVGVGGALQDLRDLAVSPDGKSLYAVASTPGAITIFTRDVSTGNLIYTGCIGQSGTSCPSLEPIKSLYNSVSVRVSPDNASVYVLSRNVNGAVSHFTRNLTTGALTFSGCIGEGLTGCTDIGPTQALAGSSSLVVTTDGNNVYATGSNPGALANFVRNTSTGSLSFAGCIGQSPAGCALLDPHTPLANARSVAASPDGAFLYVAAAVGDVAWFGRSGVPLPTASIRDVSPDDRNIAGIPMYVGRIQDVDIDPSTYASANRRMLAASDNGGLWESTDNGLQWAHVSALDQYGQSNFYAVKFNPSYPQFVYATSPNDRQSPSGAGVYLSQDGGVTWSQPTSQPSGCPQDFAREIAIDPTDGNNVYLAANCGLGVSTNKGVDFTWAYPFGLSSDYSSVMVASDGTAYACGVNGVFQRQSDGSWSSIGAPHFGSPIGCHITPDPTSVDHFFIAAFWSNPPNGSDLGAGYSDVFEGVRSGSNWSFTGLNGDPKNNGRPVRVKTRQNPNGTFELYYANSVAIDFLDCSSSNSPTHCPVGPRTFQPASNWRHVAWDGVGRVIHADPSNFLFDPSGSFHCLLLVASDGGFDRPPAYDCDGAAGSDWSQSNYGLHIQEIYDLSGTRTLERKTTLYASLQDIGFYYAQLPTILAYPWSDAWTAGDGFLTKPVPDQTFNPVHMVENTNFGWSQSLAYYSSFGELNVPAFPWIFGWVDSYADQSFVATAYMTATVNNNYLYQLFATNNVGASWTPLGSTIDISTTTSPAVASSNLVAVGNPGSPVVYTRNWGKLEQFRLSGLSSVRSPADNGLHGVGAYAASPSNPNHLYAFDCGTGASCTQGRVVSSTDGGLTWDEDVLATYLIQRDWYHNPYPLDWGCSGCGPLEEQPTAMAFDPQDDQMIVIGTYDVGVLVSLNGGTSWARLPLVVPQVTSFFFAPDRHHFYLSSYGRGVWDIKPAGTRLRLTSLGRPHLSNAAWQALLTDSNGIPLASRVIDFSLQDNNGNGLSKASATTNANGIAIASISIPGKLAIGNYRAAASFAGEGNLVPGSQALTTDFLLGTQTLSTYYVGNPVYLPVVLH